MGKSTAVVALHDLLSEHGVQHAVVEGDCPDTDDQTSPEIAEQILAASGGIRPAHPLPCRSAVVTRGERKSPAGSRRAAFQGTTAGQRIERIEATNT